MSISFGRCSAGLSPSASILLPMDPSGRSSAAPLRYAAVLIGLTASFLALALGARSVLLAITPHSSVRPVLLGIRPLAPSRSFSFREYHNGLGSSHLQSTKHSALLAPAPARPSIEDPLPLKFPMLLMLSAAIAMYGLWVRSQQNNLATFNHAVVWAASAVVGRQIIRRDVPLSLEDQAVPNNTFGKEQPFLGTIVSKELLTGPKAKGETYHIVIRTNGGIPCREGQCYGVIPPGMDIGPNGESKPHYPRLYTIATSRYGDGYDGQTTSLCVKKIAWWDQKIGGMQKELCSHFLCNAQPGTQISMIGPTANSMLLDTSKDAVHICVATGTGIAPYRAFWRRLFYENIPGYQFQGRLWLFFGAANEDELLYAQELADLQATYPDQVRLVTAYSDPPESGSKGLFVQDRIAEHAQEVFSLLQKGAHMYCSGSKLMMPGIQETLEKSATTQRIDWMDMQASLKSNKKWHVEVY